MATGERWMLVASLLLFLVLISHQHVVEAQLWPPVSLWDVYVRDEQQQQQFGSHLIKRQNDETTTSVRDDDIFETTTQLTSSLPTTQFSTTSDEDLATTTSTDETTLSSVDIPELRTVKFSEPESFQDERNLKRRPLCGAAYQLTSFTLLPPVRTQEESDDKKCRFIVERPVKSICKLHLTFNKFEFSRQNDSVECENGLSINDETFCGNLTGTSQLIKFDASLDEMLLDFDSSNIEDEDFHYNVTVRQVDCDPLLQAEPEKFEEAQLEVYGKIGGASDSAEPKVDRFRGSEIDESCNKVVDAKEFLVQSPDFPNAYPDNKDCVITVYPSSDNICSLEMRFDEFRVEPSAFIEDCENDYLEIDDDEPLSQPLKYCGIFAGVRLVEMGRLKRFRFHSNSQISDIGYSIFVKQIQCRGTETTEATTEETSSTTAGGRTTPQTTPTTSTPQIADEFPVYGAPVAPASNKPQIAVEFPEFAPQSPQTTNKPQIAVEFPEFAPQTLPSSDKPQIAVEFPEFAPESQQNTNKPQIAVEFPEFATPATSTIPYIEDTYFPVTPAAQKSVSEFDRFPTKPTFCSRSFVLSSEPIRISSPNFPNQYLDDEFCEYELEISRPNSCFVKINFLSFVLKSSAGCREDYLEISGSRICGSQFGSVLFPIDKNSRSTKLTFKTNESGRENGFDIEVSQVPCDLQLRDPDDIVIVGGSPAGSSYGSPTGNPAFNPNFQVPVESGYGSPTGFVNPALNPTVVIESVGSGYGSPSGFGGSGSVFNNQGSTEVIVDSYGSPVLSVDSIFYGSTQGSSFGKQPVQSSSQNNPFIPSLQIGGSSGSSQPVATVTSSHTNLPTSQITVVENVDSYGAPQGPLISAFDPVRPSFNPEPEIITGRPNFIINPEHDQSRPNFNNPTITFNDNSQLEGHRPNFNNPTSNSRPPFNDPSDGYGAPLAPVLPNPNPTSRPPFNDPSDGYGAPQGPVLTGKPTYGPPNRPSYKPKPGKGPNFLGPIAGIIDAKRQAVANILSGFRTPKTFGGQRPQRPSYRPTRRPNYQPSKPKPSFKLPFIGGFGGGKGNKRPQPTGRPSYKPSSGYGVPQGPVLTNKPTHNSRPTYNRPPRKTSPFLGDPRIDEKSENEEVEIPVMKCGESSIVPDTFDREFVFRSPGYPDNYPDSANCSVNIFPRKDVCALGLELEDFVLEDSSYCRSDFVAIGSRSDSNKKRICGSQAYRVIELATPENYLEPWVLEFKSDSTGHQRGFNIRATQILCSELDLEPFDLFDVDNCGVEDVIDVAGVISKQGMLEDEVCVYEIVRQKGFCSVAFVVEGLSPGSHCTESFVEINRIPFCITRQKDTSVHEFSFEEFERMEVKQELSPKNNLEDWKIVFEQQICRQNPK